MTLKNLYDLLLHILRKESKGLAVSPDAFTDMLRSENIALFNEYYRAFEAGQITTDALRTFKDISHLELSFDGATYSKYAQLPTDYLHVTGVHKGQDAETFTWTDDPHPGATGRVSPNTFTSSGTNITSYVTVLMGLDVEASTPQIALTANTTYVLRVDVTDESVSQDSDMPSIGFVIEGGLLSADTHQLVTGEQYLVATTGATGTLIIVIRSDDGEICDISAECTLTELSDVLTDVDIVTDEEWVFRRRDTLTTPSSSYPIAKIAGSSIYVLPQSMERIVLHYLRQPTDPFFDYYYDDDLNLQYLAVGGSRLLTTGEAGRQGEVAGTTVTSSTVELEWEDTEKIKILHRLLTKLSVGMDEQLVAQYATAKEQE